MNILPDWHSIKNKFYSSVKTASAYAFAGATFLIITSPLSMYVYARCTDKMDKTFFELYQAAYNDFTGYCEDSLNSWKRSNERCIENTVLNDEFKTEHTMSFPDAAVPVTYCAEKESYAPLKQTLEQLTAQKGRTLYASEIQQICRQLDKNNDYKITKTEVKP